MVAPKPIAQNWNTNTTLKRLSDSFNFNNKYRRNCTNNEILLVIDTVYFDCKGSNNHFFNKKYTLAKVSKIKYNL